MRLSLARKTHTTSVSRKPGRFSLARFLSGEGPEATPVTLSRRRVYILPTRSGLFFAGLMLVMLLGAVNYNTSLGYAMTFLLASLNLIAMLHTYRNLLHLRVDVGHIAPVFCGDAMRVSVLLDNSPGPAHYAVTLNFPGHPETLTDIPARQWARPVLSFPTTRRGRHALPRFTLRTVFPLGLFQAWAHVQPDRHYLVYPAPDNSDELPRESRYHLNLSGDRGHGSDDFAGLRTYHPGDSLRHVNWKTLARGQGLYTKQFGGDRAEELWLDWETLPELDTEARLSRLTRWVLDAEAAGFSYGLRLPGNAIPLGHGPAHQHQCLRALALFPGYGSGE